MKSYIKFSDIEKVNFEHRSNYYYRSKEIAAQLVHGHFASVGSFETASKILLAVAKPPTLAKCLLMRNAHVQEYSKRTKKNIPLMNDDPHMTIYCVRVRNAVVYG